MNSRRKLLQCVIWAIPVLLVVLVAVLVLGLRGTAAQTVTRTVDAAGSAPETEETAAAYGGTVLQDGVTYQLNPSLTTVLILGIDNSNVADQTNSAVMAGNGYSDMMLLAILDDDAKTVRLLQISRDCMLSIDVYDALGRPLTTVTQQLCYQYAYGTGRANGCRLAKNKVSELLYGVPVDMAFCLQMEGFTPLVDMLGGLALTISEDYTFIDPAFTEGAQFTLSGEQVFRYVRYRDTTELGSNNGRMARQAQVMAVLAGKLRAGGSALVEQLQKFAEPYLYSELDAETIQKLTSYTLDSAAYKVPGATRAGTHDEYIVDEQALRSQVISLFYQPVA